MTIRTESPADFPQIHELVRLAFAQAEHTDGDEHFLVDRLRCAPEYIPDLSLVAEENGQGGAQIIGHIMFSRLKVGTARALALAPLSVLPEHQGKGVGGALIRRGHELARVAGWEYVILLGHPGYYPRFGYQPAAGFGIRCPFAVPEEAFMAIKLTGESGHLPGIVTYSPAFFAEERSA